ncbi:hypothetical protein D5S18_25255 [Nocardia panacis]|uniref:Uncharacterized protein n=1 Tax=Nocardia panacis TaxID=2340916 RepID=A0A3A4JWT4_9NOCA|nr:hypothetical protein [Nocardia panacis]RJO71221.1 hypothetical protein D5S18_25255 [Nocardia panacis]
MTGTAFFVPARPRQNPPRGVLVAFVAVVTALLAGVGEGIEHVTAALREPEPNGVGLSINVGVRLAVYAVVFIVAVRMTHGARWARAVLTVGIGVFGSASLLVGPIEAVLYHPDALFDGVSADAVLVGLLRLIHIAAVFVAIGAMYRADSRAYFRP